MTGVQTCALPILGVSKIRITGGEPLVRKNISDLIKTLQTIKGLEEISLTTNATLLSTYAQELKEAGLKRINISLDTLQEDKFRKISRSNTFYRVLNGIEKAREIGFEPIKLNVVVMRNINDDEIKDFIEFSLSRGLILRFIEFMEITPMWEVDYFMPIEEIKEKCQVRFELKRIDYSGPGPAEDRKSVV